MLGVHALYLHRGPLVRSCVSRFHAAGRSVDWKRAAVSVGYVAAIVTPIWAE